MTTLIIAATEFELSWLAERLQARQEQPLLDLPVRRAEAGGASILLVTGGPGMANAAAAAAAALARHPVTRICNTGICGVFSGDTALLSRAVIGAGAVFADTGAAGPAGFQSLADMGLPLARRDGGDIYDRIPLDSTPAPAGSQLADFLTVACVTGSSQRAAELRSRFSPDTEQLLCEDMESASVGLVALRAGVPCTVVRGISNLCGERDRASWKIREAAQAAQETLYRMLQRHEPAS